MSQGNEELTPVRKFQEEYREALSSLFDESRRALEKCYASMDTSHGEDCFLGMERQMVALTTFTSIDEKLRDLKEERRKCRQEYDVFIGSRGHPPTDGENLSKASATRFQKLFLELDFIKADCGGLLTTGWNV